MTHLLARLALALLFALPAVAHAATATAGQPNIVLCMADDQGWGDVGYYGHPVLKTPNLDTLAASALRFDRFYAAAPVCSPTRASVMTGRHPHRSAVYLYGYPLRPQETTLAEVLKQAGYATGHFGKWHLGTVNPESVTNPGANGFDEWLTSPNMFDVDPVLSRGGKAEQFKGEGSMIVADAAIDFIRRKSEADQPFLAVVWFAAPHKPHVALESDRAAYPDEKPPLQRFYGEITAMDRAIGKLRQELRALGIEQNTIFWYCSDNGGLPGLGVTGGQGAKSSMFEGGLRVPAVLEWPARIPAPRVSAVPSVTSDIFPTLLAAAGIPLPDDRPRDGINLLPLIDSETSTRTQPIGFWRYYKIPTIEPPLAETLLKVQQAGDSGVMPEPYDLSIQPREKDSQQDRATWLDWPWKLHRIVAEDGSISTMLFNLEADPMERNDLAPADPDRVGAMRSELEAWQASVLASANGADY